MLYYKTVDKRAPRFRMRRFNIINRDCWQRYMEKSGRIISFSRFKKIAEAINIEYTEVALNERNGALLPEGMGVIRLMLYIPTKDTVNRAKEVIEGRETSKIEVVPIRDNVIGKIVWSFRFSKYNYKYKNNFYSFKGYRDFVYKASDNFRNCPERYVKVKIGTNQTERLKISKKENAKLKLQGGIITLEGPKQTD